MTKRILLFLLGWALLFASCDLLKKEEDSLSAPDMGTASSLPLYTGSMPASQTEAKQLFLDAKNAMDAAMSSVMANRVLASINRISPSLNQIKGLQPKASNSGTYNDVYPIGGGTVTVKGNWSESSSDYPSQIEPNKTYQIKMTQKENQTANVSGVKVPEYSTPQYTINGKYIFILDLNITITLTTDSSGSISNATLSFGIAVQMGMAMTVASTEGKGAKFIVAFPFEYSVSNVPITSENAAQQQMETELLTKLQNTQAILKVYDNSNKEIYSIQCTLNELYSMSMEEGE
ncbi:MAG: hypothetical protein N2442_11885 [Spirochaetes bacterium]|nr:hypothetical protein [Spirochaetota bacterium]